MNMDDSYSIAFKHFQEGSLEQAEKDCMEILQSDPGNSEILHLLGLTSYHLGALDRAVEYLNQSLKKDAQNADVFYDLGNIYHDQGNLEEALKAYEKALEIEHEHPDAHNNIGMVLHDLGQLDEAISHYQKALELNPQSAMIHNNIALAYEEKEELQKAIAHYGRALQIDPNYADAYFNMGNIFLKEENYDTAYAYFFKAVQLNPNLAEAYVKMAEILMNKSRFAEAIPLLGKVLMFYPDSAEMHNNLGNALGEIWHLDEAISHLDRAVQLAPDFAEAYRNLGNTLSKMGNLDEGMKHIIKAMQLNPELIEAVNTLGNIYKEKGEYREAYACYQKALLRNPDNADVRFNMALIDLIDGRFEKGWEGYELRWKMKGAQERNFPQPVWDGSSLTGKMVFICAEQGIGDEIMFASCIPEMMGHTEHCVIECSELLMPVFERSFAGAMIIKRLEGDGYPEYLLPADYRISSGSLPKFLRSDIGSFPRRNSYLVPDTGKVDDWKSRYVGLGAGLKVGISWRGGGTPDMVRVRSTVLDQWGELFRLAKVHFVSLQYGDCTEELRDAGERLGIKIYDWPDADPLKDLDAFAAKIAALDLVISVDNAAVHMAGALGTPVWILLPHACDWRWMLDFEDTPWYLSARLFRQKTIGEWGEVFDRVSRRLADASRQESFSEDALVFPVEKSYKTHG